MRTFLTAIALLAATAMTSLPASGLHPLGGTGLAPAPMGPFLGAGEGVAPITESLGGPWRRRVLAVTRRPRRTHGLFSSSGR